MGPRLRRILRALATLHDGVTRAGYLGGVAALSLITICYTYEVAARYFFSAPTTWASDLVGYSLCAGVFLMMPHVTATRAHVAVTVLVDVVPPGVARLMHGFINLIGFGFCMFAASISFDENVRQMARGILTLGTDPIPKWWVSSFITFGLSVSALHFLRHLFAPAEMTAR